MVVSSKIRALFVTEKSFGQDAAFDLCESTCTTGYDNDGSTGLEIFENGVRLGRSCGDGEIFYFKAAGTAFFFTGTDEDAVIRELKERLEEYEGEDEPYGDEDGDEDGDVAEREAARAKEQDEKEGRQS